MGRLPSSNFRGSFDDQAAHRRHHGLIEPMWDKRIVFFVNGQVEVPGPAPTGMTCEVAR
jgi:hypothetical protein